MQMIVIYFGVLLVYLTYQEKEVYSTKFMINSDRHVIAVQLQQHVFLHIMPIVQLEKSYNSIKNIYC